MTDAPIEPKDCTREAPCHLCDKYHEVSKLWALHVLGSRLNDVDDVINAEPHLRLVKDEGGEYA